MAEVFVEQPSDELTRRIEDKEKSKTQAVLRNIDSRILALIAIGVLIALYLMVNKPEVNYKGIAALLAAAVIMVIFLSKAKESAFNMLTERECKAALLKHLQWKQTHPWGDHYELPEGKVHIEPHTRLIYFDKEPVKRAIRFSVRGVRDYCYISEVNIFNGDIISIVEAPRRPSFADMPDIRTIKIPSDELKNVKNAWSFVGRRI